MEKSEAPSQSMKYKQVLKCPKCKIGTFVSSEDPYIFVVCDNCGHTRWNGTPPQNPKKEEN